MVSPHDQPLIRHFELKPQEKAKENTGTNKAEGGAEASHKIETIFIIQLFIHFIHLTFIKT